jgi:sterol desaturase/sphingolipid hydroxylase (fatty acid hydroxylase superfamily)
MELYHSRSVYKVVARAVSTINITLQIYLLCRIWPHSIGIFQQIIALLAAYVVADFVNGLVHMFMDNNDRYASFAGPLIASFHLHHKTPQYRRRNLLVVYFKESGSKIWMVAYLLAVSLAQAFFGLDPVLLHIMVYIGILSSVAEVSHYLCHCSTSPLAVFLGNIGVLLSKKHHAAHHLKDNTNYAFLNGCSDPLLNLIATTYCKGYKNSSDLHYARYDGAETVNRQSSAG